MSKIININSHRSKTHPDSDDAESKCNMIELINISKQFSSSEKESNGKNNEFTALKEISLSIALNRISVIKGPSGSGKTTLLSIIGCMSRPTSGRVRVNGKEITSLPERFLSEIRRKHFGFVFQNYNLIRGISVLENTMLPAFPTMKKPNVIKEKAAELLEKLKIFSKYNQKVEHLSGGEQQRVAIARALINDPDMIIADEPTAHLNTDLAMEFLDITAALRDEGKSVLIASHDPLLFESEIVHGIIELRDGQIVQNRGTNRFKAERNFGSNNCESHIPAAPEKKGRSIPDRRSVKDRRSTADRRSKTDRRITPERRAGNVLWLANEWRSGGDRRAGNDRRLGYERRVGYERLLSN